MSATQTPEPTRKQIATFLFAICAWRRSEATLRFKMDGKYMLVSVCEDGATQHARFGPDGAIVGDWF